MTLNKWIELALADVKVCIIIWNIFREMLTQFTIYVILT